MSLNVPIITFFCYLHVLEAEFITLNTQFFSKQRKIKLVVKTKTQLWNDKLCLISLILTTILLQIMKH